MVRSYLDNDRTCQGVVECTALVLAESCSEFDGRITLFGVLDELRPNVDDEAFYFVVYAKFEGCEHVAEGERRARILVTDEDGEVLEESAEYSVWLSGEEGPATIVATFDLQRDFEAKERLLWIEAELNEETLAQTAIPLHERYNV
jgi:hypothetical protein